MVGIGSQSRRLGSTHFAIVVSATQWRLTLTGSFRTTAVVVLDNGSACFSTLGQHFTTHSWACARWEPILYIPNDRPNSIFELKDVQGYQRKRILRASTIHGLAGSAAIMASTYKAYLGEGLGFLGNWLLPLKIPHPGRVSNLHNLQLSNCLVPAYFQHM